VNEPTRFDLDSARAAAARDDLARWVGDLLASRGSDNATLAAALAQRRHWWLGPLRVPVDELERLAGPEDDVVCTVEPDEWEDDVETMQESLDKGWEPPPLLVEHRDGRLLLQDGNHRYEALVREGETEAWVVIWFDSPEARDDFARNRASESVRRDRR
jgi:hypothetical protein